MTAPVLTPALALAYLRELSIDVRAAAVLDRDATLLAGDASLREPALRLLAALGAGAGERVEADAAGALLGVRAAGGLALVVAAGPRALVPLLLHDLRVTVGNLASPHTDVPQGSGAADAAR